MVNSDDIDPATRSARAMITPEELAVRENAALILILIATCVTVFALTLSTYAIWILWRYRDIRTLAKTNTKTKTKTKTTAVRRVAMWVPTGVRRGQTRGRVNAEIVVPAHTAPIAPMPALPAPTVSPTIGDAARRNESGYVVCSDDTRVLTSE